MKQIAIFASGNGSNTEAIIAYFKAHAAVKVALVVTNNPEAGVIKIAHSNKIISAIVSKAALNDPEILGRLLEALNIDMIVLAGFLQLIPAYLLQRYPQRIINIHGIGMYGMKVHQAVLSNGDRETGITIHFVNEHYDEGEVILQKTTAIGADDTPETVARKVQLLEHHWFPKTIEQLLS